MRYSSPATGEKPPVVSVITPAYNAAPYLADAVASVLGQTFSDLELVVVDDGSQDDTLQVARRLSGADGRVRVLSTPNGGPATARNTALRAARGEFVALLDSDDLMGPDYLARQLAVIAANPDASIVTANAINRGGGPAFDGKPFWRQTVGIQRLTVHDLIVHEDSVCILSVFRRRIFDAIGGFNAAFTGNEDYEFWLRAALAGFVIVRNFEPLGAYRRHPGSLSSDEPRMIRGVMNVLQHVDGLLGDRPSERAALCGQLQRFERELPRAELRATLQRSDAAGAARLLRALATERGGWMLSAAARVTERWPQPLLWAYRFRRGMHVA
jgi:glycosyltransferase involved in cell wall biosynthesis